MVRGSFYGEGSSYSSSVTGVKGTASGTTGVGNRYAVYGIATGGANAYGVWGDAGSASTFNAAGYFNGKIWASAYGTISDRKFKAAITPLQSTLTKILKLKPASYEFKTGEYKIMHLPSGKQLGLIADELKLVFPELVEQAVHPATYDEETKAEISPETKYEGVNYQGLIPVLVASVQELKAENDELKARLEKLEGLLKINNGTSVNVASAYLEQNHPNPSDGSTIIQYHLPSNANNSKIVITDIRGSMIKTISLSTNRNGQISLNGGLLSAGAYNYTLYVNNKMMDSKQMIITK